MKKTITLVFALAFTTVAAPAEVIPCDAIVASGGPGTYPTIQAAITAAPTNSTRPFIILVQPGTYEGPFIVPREKSHLRLVGSAVETTILNWPFNVNEKQPGPARPFNPGLTIDGNDFFARNLTIQNTSGDHGQALALMVNGDRAVFDHCRITGWQDTLMVNNGRDYFTNCFIAGRVDFIYGSATAVFDHCEIQSRNGGHVTAASTPKEKPFGFVFLDCKLTGDSRPWLNPTNPAPATDPAKKAMADLGRPWRAYASVSYLRCDMGDHIKPEGWNNWRNPTNELTARFSEYKSTGPGANPGQRAKWARQLKEEEAAAMTARNILRGSDGWDPSQSQSLK